MSKPPDDVPQWEISDEEPSWDLMAAETTPVEDVQELPRGPRATDQAPAGRQPPSTRPRSRPSGKAEAGRTGRVARAPGRRASSSPSSPSSAVRRTGGAAEGAWPVRHPWLVAWILVALSPMALVILHALDRSAAHGVVVPLQWGLSALLGVALIAAVLASARRSSARFAGGLVAAGVAAVLVWLVGQIPLGRGDCPAHAGRDLGSVAARGLFDAWEANRAGDGVWSGGVPSPEWRARTERAALVSYQREASGCFDRLGPVDVSRTWHDFRATVRQGSASLSVPLVVHTAREGDGWRVTSVDWPHR